jgi:hypothetical protein
VVVVSMEYVCRLSCRCCISVAAVVAVDARERLPPAKRGRKKKDIG